MGYFPDKVKIVNIGLPHFAKDMKEAGIEVWHVDWKPPAGGDEEVLSLLDELERETGKIAAANAEALERILAAEPRLVGMGLAGEVVPGLSGRTILHAGPPIDWDSMCGPVRGAVLGAILFENWADSPEKAMQLVEGGEVKLAPCHHYGAVGPMAGILSPSMPVFIVENESFGNRAYSSLNEGLGKVLRFGAYDSQVLERLKWMRDKLYPVLRDALAAVGGLSLKSITSQALHMGDECHNRNKAATAILFKELAPAMVRTCHPAGDIARAMEFIQANEHFHLNISMAACKSIMDSAMHIPWSTVITAMARNGTEFGIRVSALGEEWFTAPAQPVRGLYFPGFGDSDANLDLGDSSITETCGIGGFAMACAPAIVKFVGGDAEEAVRFTREMYKITVGESSHYTIPALDFRGTPTGIDLLRVLEKDLLPVINTGIAHKEPGIGQIGAGIVRPPRECFVKALRAYVKKHLAWPPAHCGRTVLPNNLNQGR